MKLVICDAGQKGSAQMTTFVMKHHHSTHSLPRHDVKTDTESLMMKTLLLGIMMCMAGGATTFIMIPDGPLSYQDMFMFGLITGTIGTVVGLAYFECKSVMMMARQATANLGLASIVGPPICYVISYWFGIEKNIMLVSPVCGLLGIGGTVLLTKIWPAFVKAIEKKAKREIRKMVGDESDG